MAQSGKYLEMETFKINGIPSEERQMLEDWANTGLKIFLDVFQSKKSKQIHGDNSKTAKQSLAADVSKNAIGFGLTTTACAMLGPSCGKVVGGVSKGLLGSVSDKVCTTIFNDMDKKKRDNILTWSDTLTKKLEKEFVTNVAHGMALICMSFKDQIKSFSANDCSKINFFNDVVRRILNYLSEHPAPSGKKLTDQVVFEAFLLGRSLYKSVNWNRGMKITSAGKKWNTKEVFEDSGLIISNGKDKFKLYTKKLNQEYDNCNEFRFVFSFENQTTLLLRYPYEIQSVNPNLKELFMQDWRLEPNSTESFIADLNIQFPKELEERKPTGHDLEVKAMIQNLTEIQQQQQNSKAKLLANKWWPEKQSLVNSFHKRKNVDGFLIVTIMNALHEDKNRMVVITHKDRVPGLGGIGKTSLAKWFAINYEDRYDFIIWMNCGEGCLLKSFKDLARDLNLENRNELDLSTLARKCYENLGGKKCLFIFDNAECYQGSEGIKDVLPHGQERFYCLITSRCQDGWGSQTGYGEISPFQLGVFSKVESLQFLEKNIKEEIVRSKYQLIQLSELLGNLPLALQLAVAALNNEKINLRDYIAKASTEDAAKIVDRTFDDYEKTINKNMEISLELIKEENDGKIAYDILMIFGYIRPENVQPAFFQQVLHIKEDILECALQLLIKYSLITKSGKTKQEISMAFLGKLLFKNSEVKEVDSLSIHRLVQQVIRHVEIKTQNETLEKILGCDGFLDYKIVPYTYADSRIQKKFPNIRKQLINTDSLVKLLTEGRFKEAIELSRLIYSDLQNSTSLYNYAVCLAKHGNFLESLRKLQEIEPLLKDEPKFYGFYGLGIIRLDCKLSQSIVFTKVINTQQQQLNTFLKEENMIEALRLAEFIHNELKSSTSLYNYALCLEKAGNIDAALEKLEYIFETTEINIDACLSHTLLVEGRNSCIQKITNQTYTFEKWKQFIDTNGWAKNYLEDNDNFVRLTNLSQQFNFMYNPAERDGQLDLWETPHKFLILSQLIRILCNSGKFERATEIFNQLMATWKSSFANEIENGIYYTELLQLMDNYDYEFNYCCDSQESPTIDLEDVLGKNVSLRLCQFSKSCYLPNNLQELTLNCLSILDNKGEKLKSFDVNHLLGSNLKKLSLISDHGYTEFTVYLDFVKNVEHINLEGCAVILGEQKINAQELRLHNVSFMRDDYVMVNVLVNNLVAFDRLTKLILEDCSVMIDFSEPSVTLDLLYLDKTKIMNWEMSEWNIDTFISLDNPFLIKNQMKIQNLQILNEFVDINLKCIPATVETLELSASVTLPLPPEPVDLPKLRYLTLHSYCSLNMSCFLNCTNITFMQLQLEDTFCVELEAIPKSVRRIWLKGKTIQVIGDGFYNLQLLILESCTIDDAKCFLTKFQSDIIVIKPKDSIECEDFKFYNSMLQKSFESNIYIGKFYWRQNKDFHNYQLSRSVDKKAEYYIFERGLGRAIEESEFETAIKTVIEES